MRILVTNDDGINARGLWTLAEALKEVAEVVVVAPDREQSAVGTSVTLRAPLRANRFVCPVEGVEAYSVEGTPGDCVILALGYLVGDSVSLVVSGINDGSNLGDDVLISGTVGAALQAHFHGLPSIAISVESQNSPSFDVAARLAALLAERLSRDDLPGDTLPNVNLPDLPLEEIEGIEITRLAQRGYRDRVEEGHDGRKNYYWIVRGEPQWEDVEGTDIWAANKRRVSITPLDSDLTNRHEPSLLKGYSSLFDDLRLGNKK